MIDLASIPVSKRTKKRPSPLHEKVIQPTTHWAFYCFKDFSQTDLKKVRIELRDWCRAQGLRGTLILAQEGYNNHLSGPKEVLEEFKDFFCQLLKITPSEWEVKETQCSYQPYSRMLVHVKSDVIPLAGYKKTPASPYIEPKELRKWIREGKEFILLDTRNEYETRIGTFKNAKKLKLKHFRHFGEILKDIEKYKEHPMVTFCTGGIRCEKAAPFLEAQGFKEVYQLKGGILNYFKECGGEGYEGECFVFDYRVSLNPKLQETQVAQCFVCRSPLTAAEQASEEYQEGLSCPFCISPSKGPNERNR